MQELDCDVCKMLRKIMQRLDSIDRRLSRLEQAGPHKNYDPVWAELETRIGNTYNWPQVYGDGQKPDPFVVGDIVWGGPDEIDQWVAMDRIHPDRWATLGVIKELEEHARNVTY